MSLSGSKWKKKNKKTEKPNPVIPSPSPQTVNRFWILVCVGRLLCFQVNESLKKNIKDAKVYLADLKKITGQGESTHTLSPPAVSGCSTVAATFLFTNFRMNPHWW